MVRPLLASLLLVGCTRAQPIQTPIQAPEPTATPPGASGDRDADTFSDPQDACPDVPGIAPDGCPERDRDGDGFLDSADRCPDDPGVAPEGCPIPDTDGDGLFDPDDRCPGEIEVKNGYQDLDGCPDGIPEDLSAIIGIFQGVVFEIDKDILKPSSFPPLDRAAQVLKQYPEIRIEISAHTDSTGSPDYGRDLPRRRAAAVRKYLVAHGIAEARIEARGAGPDEPIDTNKTAKGRARNRRIEFTILVQ